MPDDTTPKDVKDAEDELIDATDEKTIEKAKKKLAKARKKAGLTIEITISDGDDDKGKKKDAFDASAYFGD